MPRPIPTDDEIRQRAYHLWEMNGCQDGRDLDYWLLAALELEDVASGHTASLAGAAPLAANLDRANGGIFRRSA